MGKPSEPSPPDVPNPGQTAAAQTKGDVQSAVANSYLNNIQTRTPYGTSVYKKIGHQNVKGPNGSNVQVPVFHNQVTLSPEQQKLYDQQTQLGAGLNDLGISQVGRLSNVLNKPFDATDVSPQAVNSLSAPGFNNVGSGPSLTDVNGGGQYANVGNGPRLANSFNAGGPIQSGVDLTNAPTTFGNAGKITRSFGDDVGDITNTVGASDFSADRQRVEDALMSRINPQVDRDRAALESRLVNQGLTLNSDAYQKAMDEVNRQANDARMQAVLAGGQEQSRMFGMDLSKGQFENQAQLQDYNESLGKAQFGNSAQQQAYDQAQGRGLYALNATNQNNQTALAGGNFANQAQAQQYGQNQGQATFGNQARQQGYQNQLAGTEFNNNASRMGFEDQMSRVAANNAAAQQQYQNAANATQMNNATAQQGFQNQQTAGGFQNQARQQAIQEALLNRNQPMNEISALMSGGQVTAPQFAPWNASNIAGSTLAQNTYNSAALANAQYGQQMGAYNAGLGGMYGLGSSLIGGGAYLL